MPTTWRTCIQPSCTVTELRHLLALEDGAGGYTLPTEPYNEVFPNVFLGDAATALSTRALSRLGITHVINAALPPTRCGARDEFDGWVRTSESYYKHIGVKFMGIAAMDTISFDLSRYFDSAADFMDSALKSNGRILVHCHAGISRSATVVLAFLMLKRGMTVHEALLTVRERRSIRPNSGFLQQLCDLHEQNLTSRRRLLAHA